MYQRRYENLKGAITCFILVISILAAASSSMAESANRLDGVPEVYIPLVNKLATEGFHETVLLNLFKDKRVEFLTHALEINIKYVEKPEHYTRYVKPSYVKMGRKFMDRHSVFIKEVEERYGVPGEVITAILIIESKLGQKKGNYSVFNVLATVATADNESNIESNYNRLKGRFPDLKKEDIARRAKSRSGWAYGELKSLIGLAAKEGKDPLEIKGSWAGAFGIPQFIPSSFVAFSADGDADGVRDLDNLYDAIASVANYLKLHGWKPGIDEKQKKKVIWKYNHSKLYVNAVLNSSRLMAGTEDKK